MVHPTWVYLVAGSHAVSLLVWTFSGPAQRRLWAWPAWVLVWEVTGVVLIIYMVTYLR